MFKIGNTVTTMAKVDCQIINNCRPITLINTVSKIFQIAIYNQLPNFFKRFNVITDDQNGFYPGRSSEINCIYRPNLIDKRKHVGKFFLLVKAV